MQWTPALRLWRRALRLCALVIAILLSPMVVGSAYAACQTTLDFSGVALNGSKTLDVSGCSDAIRWGLYTAAVNVNAKDYFPVTGTSTNTWETGTITLPNGAKFDVSPIGTDITDETTSLNGDTPISSGNIYLFESYTVTLIQKGSSASEDYVFKYADNANPFGPYPLQQTMITDTDYTVSFTNVPFTAPLPVVNSIAPTSGPTGGGTNVVISGSGFTGASAVKFGANAATTFNIDGDTQITATSPAGAAGTVDVTVTTPGGTSTTKPEDQFTYIALPVLQDFTFGTTIPYGTSSATEIDVAAGGLVSGVPQTYNLDTQQTFGSVSIDTAGKATYTPSASFRGTDTFQVYATNMGGDSNVATVTVTVGDPTLSISLTGTGATRGKSLSGYGFSVSGGTAPYSCALAGGSLPSGVTVDSSCTLAGTPGTAGDFDFTIDVTDSSTGDGPFTQTSGTLTLSVAQLTVPTISAEFVPSSVTTGESSTLTITITNDNQSVALSNLSIGSAGLPVGPIYSSPLSTCGGTVDLSGGTLSLSGGTLAAEGSCTVTVLADTVAAGSFTYTSGAVSASETGPGLTDQATLTVTDSTDSSLSALVPSEGTLSPAFDPGTLDYSVSVPNSVTQINLKATLAQEDATFTVDGQPETSGLDSGTISLPVGDTVIPIVVTAQDGIAKTTYTVTVTRAGASNADLSDLNPSVGTLSPDFSSSVTSYAISVGNSVTDISFSPVLDDPQATLEMGLSGGGTATPNTPIPLLVGATDVIFHVIAEDGATTKTYTVTVTRAAAANASLSSLSLVTATLSPAFASGTFAYTASVPNSVTEVSVLASLADSAATLEIEGATASNGIAAGPFALAEGPNTLTIEVTASDMVTTALYEIVVTRGAGLGLSPASGALPPGVVGLAYSETIAVSNGASPYIFSLGAGALPDGLTLDTQSGEISGVPTTPGTASFTVKVGDASSPPVSVAVDYTLTIDAMAGGGQVVADTHEIVSEFVEARQNLLATTITAPSLADRPDGQPGVVIQPSPDGVVLAFAASLAQVEAAERLAAGDMTVETNPFNLWIDGSLSFTNRPANGGNWGNFGLVSAGADYLLTDQLLLGLALHYDHTMDPAATDTTITGDGWLVGPYASAELGEGVFLDLSALYGGSSNRLDGPVWDGDFGTERWLLNASLSGIWQLDEATSLAPRLRALYQSETVADYTIEDGMGGSMDVAGSVSEELALSLGAKLAHRIGLDDGAALTPRLDAAAGLSGLALDTMFGSLEAGLAFDAAADWTLESGVLVTLDSEGSTSVGARLGLSGRM